LLCLKKIPNVEGKNEGLFKKKQKDPQVSPVF